MGKTFIEFNLLGYILNTVQCVELSDVSVDRVSVLHLLAC
jgi:hypothetical protein